MTDSAPASVWWCGRWWTSSGGSSTSGTSAASRSDYTAIQIWRETVECANDLIQRMAAEIERLEAVINEMAVRINENSGAADDGPAATP